ncbi:MAG: hypothetical protein AVO34_00945 [Firmicutes bacterium ML8_F2]|jgi:putative zinc finger/helix-turn-helix YgiT family protein|nr:MAG: hypothetical protein AVO34_00945 [Firmicutes bacterium ML8_F2]
MSIDTKLCLSCMEAHQIQQVTVKEENIFKGKRVEYQAKYEYCPNTDAYTATDEIIDLNDISFKDAYRKAVGLLTSEEIIAIRNMYGVSQKDFSKILGWGSSTITRYENHQVQDSVHDDVLKKVSDDPKWFIKLLKRAKDDLSEKVYHKYLKKANEGYHSHRNRYLKDSIEALYASFEGDNVFTGNTKINIDKTVEVINYLALKVKELHKVKLMKMLWFSDFLYYKKENKSITGLVYRALPMGAVPVGHETLLLLDGVCYEEIQYDEYENSGYKFHSAQGVRFNRLTDSEKNTLEEVIRHFQYDSAKEIIDKMHQEEAYQKTEKLNLISYEYAKHLSI